jgi:hypothetical protein
LPQLQAVAVAVVIILLQLTMALLVVQEVVAFNGLVLAVLRLWGKGLLGV